MPKRQRTVICAFADSHAGSPVGVMLPKTYQGKNGDIEPTETQRVLYDIVTAHIEKVNGLRQTGDRLLVVHVGDAVEGKHHGSTETTTSLVSEHEGLHIAWMEDNLKRLNFGKRDTLIYIAGTEAHNGSQNESEHRIGKDLKARPAKKPQMDGTGGWYAWSRLLLDVNGVLLDFAHHPGVSAGRKAWGKANSLYNYLTNLYFQSLNAGTRLPRYWVRADRHVQVAAKYSDKHGTIEGLIMPALQAKTEYVYKVAADALPTLGAWWCVIEADGTTYHDFTLLEYAQDRVITL